MIQCVDYSNKRSSDDSHYCVKVTSMHTVEANCENCESETGVGTNICFGSVFQQDWKRYCHGPHYFSCKLRIYVSPVLLAFVKSDTFSHLVAWQPHLFATAVWHVFPVLGRWTIRINATWPSVYRILLYSLPFNWRSCAWMLWEHILLHWKNFVCFLM